MSTQPTLRKGSKGKEVLKLQKLLSKLLKLPKLTADGDFGQNTEKAVKAFQRETKLTADGIVGTNTWTALANASIESSIVISPQNTLAGIAAKYLGVRETGNNRAGSSNEMLEIFEADDLVINGKTDGYPWCAAFVSLCVQKLCQSSPYYGTLTPPREPSVNRFLTLWAKQNNCLTFSPTSKIYTPMAGDIVVFTFSHIGIVESVNGNVLTTIEGNTNAAGSREGVTVARKLRNISIIRSVIRLPMTTIKLDHSLNQYSYYC